MGVVAAGAAVASVAVAGASVAVGANKSSIASKRAKNAAAEAKRAQDEQTAALQALEAEPAAAIPDPEATKRARRRSITRQLGRGGRQSTILTGGGDSGQGTLG